MIIFASAVPLYTIAIKQHFKIRISIPDTFCVGYVFYTHRTKKTALCLPYAQGKRSKAHYGIAGSF